MSLINQYRKKKIEKNYSIDFNDLYYGKLYTLKDEYKGYISLNEVFHKMCRTSYDYPDNTGYNLHFSPDNNVFEEREIVYKKLRRKVWKTSYQVQELLTEEKFDYVGFAKADIIDYDKNHESIFSFLAVDIRDEIYSWQEELDCFVVDEPLRKNDKIKSIWDYIKNHQDIESYKKFLINLKEQSIELHLKSINRERTEDFKTLLKKYITENNIIQYKNYSIAMNICIDYMNKNGIEFIQESSIDSLLFDIKRNNPGLSNDLINDISKVLSVIKMLKYNKEEKIVKEYTYVNSYHPRLK